MPVAALVLGILGTVFSLVPVIGYFVGIPLSVMALIFGIVGRKHASREGQPTGMSTAGIVLGSIGFLLGATVFAACVWLGAKGQQLVNEDPEFRRQVEEFNRALKQQNDRGRREAPSTPAPPPASSPPPALPKGPAALDPTPPPTPPAHP